MDPATMMMASTAMSIVQGWAANLAEADAQRKNAEYYREQANYAAISAVRAKAIAEIDYTTKVGAQISAYASGGVDISGSAAATVGGTIKNAIDEMRVIKLKGDLDVKLANLRGIQSQASADMLGSAGYNIMQGAGKGLKYAAASKGFGAYNTEE